DPRVALEVAPGGRRDRAQRRAPALVQLGVVDELPAEDRVAHEVEQLVLAADVVVQAHRPQPELAGDTAHGDRVDPLGVGDRDRPPPRGGPPGKGGRAARSARGAPRSDRRRPGHAVPGAARGDLRGLPLTSRTVYYSRTTYKKASPEKTRKADPPRTASWPPRR